MKKNLLIALLIIVCQNVFGQTEPKSYINKHLRIDTMSESDKRWNVDGFFKNLKQPLNDESNILFAVKYFKKSSFDSLKNIVFVCEDAGVFDDQNYLKLNSPKTGVCYYVYSKIFSRVPLICIEDKEQIIADMVKRTQDLAANPCLAVRYQYDELEKEKQYATPTDKVMITKYIKKGVPTYFIFLSTRGQQAQATKKGVIILLKNGKRILKPSEEVDSDVDNQDGYARSAGFNLTAADIAILKTSPIKSYRLYNDDDTPDDEDMLYQTFLCLFNKK